MTRTKQIPVTEKHPRISFKAARTVAKDKHTKTKAPVAPAPAARKRPAADIGRNGMDVIRKATIKRLLLKGGVLRVSRPSYKATRVIMYSFLKELLKNAHVYAKNCERKTINAMDIVDGLGQLGHRFLGHGSL